MLPSGSFGSIHAPFHNNLEWSEHRGQRFRYLPVTITRVFIYYSFESCARENAWFANWVWMSLKQIPQFLIMLVWTLATMLICQCTQWELMYQRLLSFLLPAPLFSQQQYWPNNRKVQKTAPNTYHPVFQSAWGWGWVSLCFYSSAGVICSELTLCTVLSAFNVRLLNSFLLLFFSM